MNLPDLVYISIDYRIVSSSSSSPVVSWSVMTFLFPPSKVVMNGADDDGRSFSSKYKRG
jgi:hypothetical protein